MVWFYEREGGLLQYEVRRADQDGGYELVITLPDGSERIGRFQRPTELIEESLRTQRTLMNSGWRPPPSHRQAELLHQLEALEWLGRD